MSGSALASEKAVIDRALLLNLPCCSCTVYPRALVYVTVNQAALTNFKFCLNMFKSKNV